MKTDFFQPSFKGGRFTEHSLPVAVAPDLAAYEALIVALAKHLYRQDHPGRQRLPKGFAAGFRLDITRIDEGSTRPLLAAVAAGTLALSGEEPSYFEKARDLVCECIAAPMNQLPKTFPKELLSRFNEFGRALREDEILELPRTNESPAILTPLRRKELILAAEGVYKREISLLGHIEEVDFAKSSLRLRLTDANNGTVTVPMSESFQETARIYGGRERHLVSLSGIGTYDERDQLRGVAEVSTLEIIPNYTLSTRLEEIAQLEDGWFEGGGRAPNAEALANATEKLTDYPDTLPLPLIVPTQDGSLLIEWNTAGDPSLDIDLISLHASYHAFGLNGDDIEQEFILDDAGWQALFAFLANNIKEGQK